MNILLDRLHQKILNNDSLMKEVTELELLALVEAKEKQMPKKMESYYCPNCRHYFEDGEEHNYCPSCGQRLTI